MWTRPNRNPRAQSLFTFFPFLPHLFHSIHISTSPPLRPSQSELLLAPRTPLPTPTPPPPATVNARDMSLSESGGRGQRKRERRWFWGAAETAETSVENIREKEEDARREVGGGGLTARKRGKWASSYQLSRDFYRKKKKGDFASPRFFLPGKRWFEQDGRTEIFSLCIAR